MRIRINETSPAATDELSEPTGPQLLAANMKRGFKTLGDAASSAATGESGAGELTGPQILAMNMKRGFGADAKKADPWGPPWGHRVPAKEKTAPGAPAGSARRSFARGQRSGGRAGTSCHRQTQGRGGSSRPDGQSDPSKKGPAARARHDAPRAAVWR